MHILISPCSLGNTSTFHIYILLDNFFTSLNLMEVLPVSFRLCKDWHIILKTLLSMARSSGSRFFSTTAKYCRLLNKIPSFYGHDCMLWLDILLSIASHSDKSNNCEVVSMDITLKGYPSSNVIT